MLICWTIENIKTMCGSGKEGVQKTDNDKEENRQQGPVCDTWAV